MSTDATTPDAIVLITFDEFTTIAPLLVNAGQSAENFYLVDGNLKQWDTDVSVSLEGAKGTTPGPVLADDFQERLNDVKDLSAAKQSRAQDDESGAAEQSRAQDDKPGAAEKNRAPNEKPRVAAFFEFMTQEAATLRPILTG